MAFSFLIFIFMKLLFRCIPFSSLKDSVPISIFSTLKFLLLRISAIPTTRYILRPLPAIVTVLVLDVNARTAPT